MLGKLPLNPKIAEAIDNGAVEELQGEWLDSAADFIENQVINAEDDEDDEPIIKPE